MVVNGSATADTQCGAITTTTLAPTTTAQEPIATTTTQAPITAATSKRKKFFEDQLSDAARLSSTLYISVLVLSFLY